jgi:hypothetical protein
VNVNVNVNVVVKVLVIALALTLAACRPDDELLPPDLSSTALYCPASPPAADDPFVCDPTAIPYCTYPAQQLTCTCLATHLHCAPEFSDGGAAQD